MNIGREALGWSEETWARIDEAVLAEAQRAEVASKFIPILGPFPNALTVPAETIDPKLMSIDDSAVTPMVELWVEFALSTAQVEGEAQLGTAVTLATRAATMLSQAEDLIIFQGIKDPRAFPLKGVQLRAGAKLSGLVEAAANSVAVEPVQNEPLKYGERTFEAAAKGYSVLQDQGHHGPYALALHADAYADTFAPLANTLVMPADRIKPLVSGHFYGTGTLPASTGVLVSAGGNAMDLVVGADPTAAFMGINSEGAYRLRVFERFTLRLKDPASVVRLDFKPAD